MYFKELEMFENFNCPKELIPSDPRFGSGPSLVPMEFVQRLAQTGSSLLGTSHRKSAIKNLVKEVQDGLRQYFNLPSEYEVILGNGGATFLWDMIGLGLVENSSAHFTCGEFSQKWYKAHKQIPWINASEFAVDFGSGINPEIKKDFDMICTTLNETSTGVMINQWPTEIPDNVILACDATSGAGQILAPLEKIDFYYFSPQKVFASEGGLYIAFMSPKAIERARKLESQKNYIPEVMRFSLAIDNSKQNQTYNTPAISTIFYLNEQIKLMNELGQSKVCELAQKKANLVYGWAESKPYLSCYIKDNSMRSHAVATIDVDDKYPVDDLIKKLRTDKIVYDIDAYRKLGRNQFRISMFHNVSFENLEKLTKLISLAIESN